MLNFKAASRWHTFLVWALVFASFRSRPTTHSQRFADKSEIEEVKKLSSEEVKSKQLRKWETRKLASKEVKSEQLKKWETRKLASDEVKSEQMRKWETKKWSSDSRTSPKVR